MHILMAMGAFMASPRDIFFRLFPPPAAVVPFSADRNGSTAELMLHVSRDAPYSFELKLGFDGEVARARLQPLVGDGRYSPSGVRLNNGIPIPVALKITRANGTAKVDILDREFSDLEFAGFTGSSFIKTITVVSLRTGDYKVRVFSLRDVPEFHGVPINFDVHVALRK
jgi:hypothetical protein